MKTHSCPLCGPDVKFYAWASLELHIAVVHAKHDKYPIIKIAENALGKKYLDFLLVCVNKREEAQRYANVPTV